ncbi:MAG: rane protein, partial [Rhizobacter sp.]|nr:rane protein [Rhizobacter sp.]
AFAPEYSATNLTRWSMERLRYGLWLSRQINVPVGFAGGVGWAQNGPLEPEAKVAARIAETEFGQPLRWTEGASRDTRENATNMMALLRPAGVKQVLLVTHGWHMARALAVFRQATGPGVEVRAAPMGLASTTEGMATDWLPSSEGFTQVRQLLREWLGRLVGA